MQLLSKTPGKRGPSFFVFEKVYQTTFTPQDIVQFRETLNLTQYDLAMALGITKVTLQRIMTGLSHDMNILRLLQIYFTFPEVALWQLQQTGTNVHYTAHARLEKYFKQGLKASPL
jgi:transcriptional regulator with XRE-family HTH domain